MAKITIKQHEFEIRPIRDSYDRRAQLFRNNIIETVSKIGVPEHQVDVELAINARMNAPGVAIWYLDGHRLQYSHKSFTKYAENLYVVSKVIELKVNELLAKVITKDEFFAEFTENNDVEKRRVEARILLGVDPQELDLEVITKKYKILAKQHHPDMDNGSTETFKKINNAFQILKRELQ